ncbi:MAG: M16 family metallopeptidase [Gemmatimonadaceae bacterium]
MRILLALLLLLAPPSANAAVPVTWPMTPDTSTTKFVVEGVTIIHRRAPGDLVVANLYLLGGVRLTTPATAGIEPFLLEVSERGTRRYPGDQLRRAMARTGSGIGVVPHEDYTIFGLRTTRARLDSAWSIYTDRLMHPTLREADVAFVRENRVAALAQRGDDADALLEYLADSVAFAGHPYGLSSVGTDRSIARITAEELRAFHQERMVSSRMLLVVVGDLSRERLTALVRGTLGTLPVGDYQWTLPEPITERVGSGVHLVTQRLPTNYILGWWSGPPAGHPDVPALRVATAILSGRLFAEVRSRRNLTYAVEARFRDRALTSGGLYVTTTRPEETLRIMREELRALQQMTIPTEALAPLIQQFITEYFLDNETTAAQADFLAKAELYRGDFRAGERFIADLRAVTGEDVRRVAQTWMKQVRFTYLGNPAIVNRFTMLSF